MGFIPNLEKFRALKAQMEAIQEEAQRKRERYLSLSPGELAELPDDELFDAVTTRIDSIVYEEHGFAALNGHQRLVFAVNTLEMEVNNGGLCQFFVNNSRVVAPYVSGGLGDIGAAEHKELFDGFIGRYGIDVNDLSSFAIRRVRDFEKQTKRYPFDEYDDKFYTLPSLREPLTAYIREHLNEFK